MLRKIFVALSLLICLLTPAAAQSTCPAAYPIVTGGVWDAQCNFIPAASQAQFNAAYWASQPPAIQAQRGTMTLNSAMSLYQAGYLIDGNIMLGGQDPYTITSMRVIDGYTWVPNFFQPPLPLGPGINFGGLPTYDPFHPQAGSIAVTMDLAKLPPYGGVPTPPAPVAQSVIGVLAHDNIYYGGPGDSMQKYPNGAVYTNAQGTFIKTVVIGLMGPSAYWTLQLPSNKKK